MANKKLAGIGLLAALIAASVIVFLTVDNEWIASFCLLGLLLIHFVYQVILKRLKIRFENEIVRQNIRINASIISSKTFRKNTLILQFLIQNQEQNYITSHVIKRANPVQLFEYVKDAKIAVYINPKNKFEVFIADKIEDQKTDNHYNWLEIFIALISISLFVLPFFLDRSHDVSESFEDSKIIKLNKQQYQVWELKLKNSEEIQISVYDPLTNNKIAGITDKKDSLFDTRGHLSIYQQKDKIFILGNHYTPYFDIYDAVSLKKTADIRQFQQSNQFVNDGIASMNEYSIKSKFGKEKIYELVTNNGNEYFYDFSQNIFYFSEKEVKRNIYQTDSAFMSQHMYSLILLVGFTNEEKYQVCLIEAVSKKNLDDLIFYSGNNSIDPRTFLDLSDKYPDWEKPVYKVEKKPVPKPIAEFFYYAKISYFDFEMIVIEHKVKVDNEVFIHITGIDKTGKTIFNISQNSFPNIKKMIENNFINNSNFHYIAFRDNDNLIINFPEYGSICIDLKSGIQIWKFTLQLI